MTYLLIFGCIFIVGAIIYVTHHAKKAPVVPAPTPQPPPTPSPTLPPYGEYDSAFSSKENWGQIYQDQTLELNGTSVTTSVAQAGTIVSLKENGFEYIFGWGHGSALNWDMHPTPLGGPFLATECYNPTLSGCTADDANTSNAWPTLNGPSTSRILDWSKGATIKSITQMAFYAIEGGTGYAGCTAHYPAKYETSPRGTLSPFYFSQEVELQDGILQVKGIVTCQDDHDGRYDMISILYPSLSFKHLYNYDGTPLPFASRDGRDNPMIISTEDDLHAIGIYAPPSPQEIEGRENHGYYFSYTVDPYYTQTVPTLQCTFYGSRGDVMASGTSMEFTVYYYFGPLAKVIENIRKVYTH